MRHEANPDLYVRFELEARSLLLRIESGELPDLRPLSCTLGTTVEFMLCSMFREHEVTYWYWVDGVEVHAVELQPPRQLLITGRAWCADDHDQWLVPAQILVGFLDDREPSIAFSKFRIGDAALVTLKDHREAKKRMGEPDQWLFEFDVFRPTPPRPLSVEPFAARLRNWTSTNSTRPVVGPGWEYFTRDQAIQYIESRAAQGFAVMFTETWLDGGPALRIE